MKLNDITESAAFAIDVSTPEKFTESLNRAIDAAIQMCGPRKAIEAALFAQQVELGKLMEAMKACRDHQGDAETTIFPMTPDVTNQMNRIVATSALVSGMMEKGVMDMENVKQTIN